MKPFREYELATIIQNQWRSIYEKIDGFPNEVIMANDLEILADNLYQEFYIQPLEILDEDFTKRKIEQGKVKRRIDPFFRDYYQNEYIELDGIVARFYYPFLGDRQLFECRASVFSMGGYPEISLEKNYVIFRMEKTLDEMKQSGAKERLQKDLSQAVESIKSGIRYVNSDVNAFNNSLRNTALSELKKKKEKVEVYFNVATMFEVPVEKKEYAMQHIPLERKIIPISYSYDQEDYYGITEAEYNDIISSIKHTASTYERTPDSYRSMNEEDLRNTLLAALNATYKGRANGETFRSRGKTDINIEAENRAAFVAECKMWAGKSAVEKAIQQLDGYLTWRDYKTALIYFVRRKDFLNVLQEAKTSLQSIEYVKKVKEIDKNEFECVYLSSSNVGQQIQLRVLLFNLYSHQNNQQNGR